MTDIEYSATQEGLTVVSALVSGLNLDGFLSRIEKAKTLGPVLDPTLYLKAANNLGKIERLARAAKEMQKVALQFGGGIK